MSSEDVTPDDESAMLNLIHFSDSSNRNLPLMEQQQVIHQAMPNGYSSEQHRSFSQPMPNFLQDSSVLTMSQRVIGQQLGQGNNGFAHSTMANSDQLPNHHQEQDIPIPLVIQQQNAAPFGSPFPQQFGHFSNTNGLPYVIATTSQNLVQHQRQRLHANTLSTREPMLSNQYHSYYNLDQIMAVNSEHSNLIGPRNNVVPNRSSNHMMNQTNVSFRSSFNINGQQFRPSALANWPNEPPNPRVVNNSAELHGSMPRLGRQYSSGSRSSNFNTQMGIRPWTNPTIPPQGGVLGTRRRSETLDQFEELASSSRRRRVTTAQGNVGSRRIYAGEERAPYGLYDPIYESLGLHIDPHLRSLALLMRNGR